MLKDERECGITVATGMGGRVEQGIMFNGYRALVGGNEQFWI